MQHVRRFASVENGRKRLFPPPSSLLLSLVARAGWYTHTFFSLMAGGRRVPIPFAIPPHLDAARRERESPRDNISPIIGNSHGNSVIFPDKWAKLEQTQSRSSRAAVPPFYPTHPGRAGAISEMTQVEKCHRRFPPTPGEGGGSAVGKGEGRGTPSS